jgi:c-di-GMP-binding flagellar brake protein YcgR
MFEHTQPAELDAHGGADPWAPFRVGHPQERLRLLKELRDGSVPVILNAPDGSVLSTSVWTVDTVRQRLNFSAEPQAPALQQLVNADEAVAVAYLQSVKLQFDLHGFVLVRGAASCALQSDLPAEIYRFQRRHAFRVRPSGRHGPHALLRHPALPEMLLSLRVLDLSSGGCALWLPHDVPPLQAGTRLAGIEIVLGEETRFSAGLTLQHVSSLGRSEAGDHGDGTAAGARLGCEWHALAPGAARVLQRWIDRSQQRHRLLSL